MEKTASYSNRVALDQHVAIHMQTGIHTYPFTIPHVPHTNTHIPLQIPRAICIHRSTNTYYRPHHIYTHVDHTCKWTVTAYQHKHTSICITHVSRTHYTACGHMHTIHTWRHTCVHVCTLTRSRVSPDLGREYSDGRISSLSLLLSIWVCNKS